MSPAQRNAVDLVCTPQWSARVYQPWATHALAVEAQIKKAKDRHITELDRAQLAQWQAAAKPVDADWAKAATKAGYDPQNVRSGLEDALKKAGAAL